MRIIKLMADYQCYPLWEASPGQVGNIDPASLPISPDLVIRLTEWARLYDANLKLDDPARSGFKSHEERLEFIEIGHRLAKDLQAELGTEYLIVEKKTSGSKLLY
jgi:hypothetical protein